jgi:hypothetical protein
VYAVILLAAARTLMPLGLLGGLILSLVAAACASGYLHLLSQAVSGSRLSFADFKRGFGALFWDVVSVMFALWVISLGVSVLAGGAGPNAPAVQAIVGLAMAFFLNPVPELLYLGRTRSFALLMQSGRFVMAHPLAWFAPNLVFALCALAPTGQLAFNHPGELLLLFSRIFSVAGLPMIFGRVPELAWPVLLLFVHYVMVFRGLLFQELGSSNPRLRAWREQLR